MALSRRTTNRTGYGNLNALLKFVGVWGIVGTIYGIGRTCVWWYHVGVSLHRPYFAPWLDPGAWMTSMAIVGQLWHLGKVRLAMFLFPAVAAQLILSLHIIRIRKVAGDHFGTVSYTLLPSFPLQSLSLSEECLTLISTPTSKLHSDPLISNYILLQTFQLVFTPLFILTIFDPNGLYLAKIFITGIYTLGGLLWTSIWAAQGTPFMWNNICGVVVIAMSPKLGYWDAETRSSAYVLQIIRGVFGLCTCCKLSIIHMVTNQFFYRAE